MKIEEILNEEVVDSVTPLHSERSSIHPPLDTDSRANFRSIDSLNDPFSTASDLLRTWTVQAKEFEALYDMDSEFKAMMKDMGNNGTEDIIEETESKNSSSNIHTEAQNVAVVGNDNTVSSQVKAVNRLSGKPIDFMQRIPRVPGSVENIIKKRQSMEIGVKKSPVV